MKNFLSIVAEVLIVALWLAAPHLICIWLSFTFGGWYFWGLIAGAANAWYIYSYLRMLENLRAWDKAMTSMMNWVPKENRYGYTDDFPEDTKWNL